MIGVLHFHRPCQTPASVLHAPRQLTQSQGLFAMIVCRLMLTLQGPMGQHQGGVGLREGGPRGPSSLVSLQFAPWSAHIRMQFLLRDVGGSGASHFAMSTGYVQS